MTAYTTNQILDLIIDIKSKDDITEIWEYIVANKYKYCLTDLQNFKFLIELNRMAYR